MFLIYLQLKFKALNQEGLSSKMKVNHSVKTIRNLSDFG